VAGLAVPGRFFTVILFVNVKDNIAGVAADQHHGVWTVGSG